jgi:hypothetical protein
VEGGGLDVMATGGKSKVKGGDRRLIKCKEVEIYLIN